METLSIKLARYQGFVMFSALLNARLGSSGTTIELFSPGSMFCSAEISTNSAVLHLQESCDAYLFKKV